MTRPVLLLDSITDAGPDAAGAVAICGSHGGLYAASLASQAGLHGVILNDAGIGLNGAGIAGVRALADCGMAACAVDCMSAEIGAASDMQAHGVVSYANAVAARLGIAPGQSAAEAADRLGDAPAPTGLMDPVPEARQEVTLAPGAPRVLCVDSAALIRPGEDDGRIIVTGSHGGLIGGDPARACKAAARLVAFNDAGIGKNAAGTTRLPALQARGIAAVTLDAQSCAIGDARSGLATGVISRVNGAAAALGLVPGTVLRTAIGSPGGLDG
jgi:hypothetical protein